MSKRRSSTSRGTRSAAAGSWLALVAATTLGDGFDTLRACVRADGLTEGAYRLVVQSYEASAGGVPERWARPVGSVQRAVTADELRAGVQVSVVERRPRADGGPSEEPVVVAWVEAGEPNLEFDGQTARPGPGSILVGLAKRGAKQDAVQIDLNRSA